MKDLKQQLKIKMKPSKARERIEKLLDKDSFMEFHTFTSSRLVKSKKLINDAVVTGTGTIDGRKVYIYSQNFAEMGGSLGEMHAKKICYVYDLALSTGCPVISILDSGGARIQEGIYALNGYGDIFKRNVEASGRILQLSIIAGACAGGAAYSPALTDFVFMIKDQSLMFVTGPKIIKTVTGEEVSLEELGGALTHNAKSGVAHFAIANEDGCFSLIKQLFSYLPSNNLDDAPVFISHDPVDRSCKKLERIVPKDDSKVYDMKKVIDCVFDEKSFLGLQRYYARNAIIGFTRMEGRTVGVVANQPKVKAGCLDIKASCKIARFVRFCDSFNIPLVNFIDVPGYLPGTSEEHNGIIRHGAKVLYAYSDAQVPKIALILRKAYGGAYIALASKALGYDSVIAWEGAQVAVMGARQAVELLNSKDKMSKKQIDIKVRRYSKKYLDIFKTAQTDKIDMLIERKDSREAIGMLLRTLSTKAYEKTNKRHGNIPL